MGRARSRVQPLGEASHAAALFSQVWDVCADLSDMVIMEPAGIQYHRCRVLASLACIHMLDHSLGDIIIMYEQLSSARVFR